MPIGSLARRKPRPLSGISSNVSQHAILVRDTSTSMSGQKITELNLASQALAQVLADPKNKDAFRVSVIDFDSTARTVVSGKAVSEFTMPDARASGGTAFNAALQETLKQINDFKALPNPEGRGFMRPHVLFLSDGQSAVNDPNIDAVKEWASVTAIAFGRDADQSTLKRISSDGQVHFVGTNGGELRAFLSQIGHTMSIEIQRAA